MTTTIEQLHTVTSYIPNRIHRLWQLGYISREQRCAAMEIKHMWHHPDQRTPEYVRWAKHQNSQIIDGLHLNASRYMIVIDVVIQDMSLAEIEDTLRMQRDSVLGHLTTALDELRL